MASDDRADVPGQRPARWLRAETGAAWLDLVATVRWPYGPAPEELLTSPVLLGQWLDTQGLRPRADPDDEDLRQARELRGALERVALAVLRDETLSRKDLRRINLTLAADRPLALRPTGGLAAPGTSAEALARLARRAAEDLGGPAAVTLGQCGDHDCGMLFLDPSGRRRWCSAEICGVRHRVREHRRRNQADA